MPVSKCAECGGDISSHAKECPHCQAPKAKAFPQLTECAECGKEFNLLTEKKCPGCGAPKKMAAPQYDGNSEMVKKASAFGQAHRGKIKLTLVAILLTFAVIYLYPTSKPGAKSPTEFGERLFESISKNDFKLFSSLWVEGWSDEISSELYMYRWRHEISYKEYKEKGLAEATPQQALKFLLEEEENKKYLDFRAEFQSELKERYEGLLNSLKEIGFDPKKAVLKEVDVSNVWKDHKGDYVDGALSPIEIRISINREDYIIMFVLANDDKRGWYPVVLASLWHLRNDLRNEYGMGHDLNAYWIIRKQARKQARRSTANKTCQLNLEAIEGAMERWRGVNFKGDAEVPTEEEMVVYLKDERMPKCPGGGDYSLGLVNAEGNSTVISDGDDGSPECSVHGSRRD